MIFQDPYSSLNPRMTVEQTLTEPLALHGLATGRHHERAVELMDLVGLSSQYLQRYPHEFSGGQRQRIGIARALAVEPKLIVCDEAVSALDVSIQAQVINLLQDLQKRLGLAYVFIAHDLAVVKHIASHVAVMYLGHMVEYSRQTQLVCRAPPPLHPGLALGHSAARAWSEARARAAPGRCAQPHQPALGLPLRTRCPHAQERCAQEVPVLRPTDASASHLVACHFWEQIEAPQTMAQAPAVNERLLRLQQAFGAGHGALPAGMLG
jgi:oligopeptide transport system ATP-binding protein